MALSETALSVSNLNQYVNSLLENDVRLKNVRVRGEITGFKRHSSGHLYFSLKDDGALVRCVMFKSRASLLKFEPKDGMQVVLSGSVSLYVKDGQYQFYAVSMRDAGEGELYRQFLELKEKLNAEGLFSRKRTIPFLPKRIGVVTSDTGAALQDILTVIRRRFPTMNVLVAPAKVQGEDAPRELISALEVLNADHRSEVIIIGRGGGSYEDLSCFNDEALARAIYASDIPVVSAVGHEVDFTIADFVADLRAPTPSAAAEICVPELFVLMDGVKQQQRRMDNAVITAIEGAKKHIELLGRDSVLANPKTMIELKRNALDASVQKLETAAAQTVTAAYSKLDVLRQRLDALDPFAVLKRGYAMVTDEEGKTVASASALNAGDRVKITFGDGAVNANIDGE